MNKINEIIMDEFKKFVAEMIDVNGGGSYLPPGLDPKVMKLFEDINEDFYQSTLDDPYWQEISKLYPVYNAANTADHIKAVDYIIKGMKNKYPDQDWNNIEEDMRNKVSAGLT